MSRVDSYNSYQSINNRNPKDEVMINSSCVVLNSTFEPLAVVPARRALILCLQEKATVLQSYEYVVRSPSVEINLPSTIALKEYIRTRKLHTKRALLNKKNLLIRDDHQCQYCGRGANELKSREELTRDHIIPKKRGGPNTWENMVTSCSSCNHKKADLTLDQVGYILKSKPYAPSMFDIFAKSKMKQFNLEKIYEEVSCSI
jgi:5-methylcytosine-specific restriction endonuclease McrA